MSNVVKKQHGFTLLELVVVVAVLGLIASMATEFVAYESNQTRYDLTKERRDNIREAMANYHTDCNGNFPENLKGLIEKPSTGCSGWGGPYIFDVDFQSGVPVYRDGWGNSSGALSSDVNYGWEYIGTPISMSVAVISLGLDGASGAISSGVNSPEAFELDYGRNFPLLTEDQLTASTGNYQLRSEVVSGASYSALNCYSDDTASAAKVSMSFCMQ